MNQRWYCRIGREVKGPLEFEMLQSLASSGGLRPDDEVRTTRSQEWSRASTIPRLFPQVAVADDLAAMLSEEGSASADNSRAEQADAQCYCRIRGQVRGPMTFEEVGQLASSGTLSPRDEVRLGATADWIQAGTIVGLFQTRPESFPAAEPIPPFRPGTRVASDDSDVAPVSSINVRDVESGGGFNARPRSAPAAAPVSTAYGETTDEKTWHVLLNGVEVGPFTFGEVFDLAHSGRMTRGDKVRDGRTGPWLATNSIVGLFPDEAAIDDDVPVAPLVEPRRRTDAAERDRPVPERATQTRQRRREPMKSKRSAVEADEMAIEALASQPPPTARRVAASAAETVETDAAVRETREADRPTPVSRTPAPPSPPVQRTPSRPPPPRKAPRTESVFANLNLGVKQIAAVAVVLVAGAAWYFGLPSFSFGSGGPTAELQTIWLELVVLRDQDVLPMDQWNKFKDQTLPKVQELATKLEAEGAGDPETEKMLRCCREYLPAIFEAGPTKKPPEWNKMQDAMTEATS